MPKLFHDDSGVSVIVGALLLILITVIAAASLAMIVSQAEKQQADRQARVDAVNNEKLVINSIQPHYDYNGNIDMLNISVQNLNVQDSIIFFISVNGVYLKNYTCDHQDYDYINRLIIPGSGNKTITMINLTTNNTIDLDPTKPITIQITTSYINYFERIFKPPSAVAKFNVEVEDLGSAQRDYVLLDASDSNSDNSQIVLYNWSIYNKDSHSTNIGNPKNITTSGKITRFNPPRNDSSGFGVYGYGIYLTVYDNMGLAGNAEELYLPADQNFNPPVSLTVSKINDGVNETIIAQLLDASGHGVPDAVINFITNVGNFYMNPISNTTNSSGIAISNASKVWDINHNNVVNGSITITYSNNNKLYQMITIP